MNKVSYKDLGLIGYQSAWDFQKEIFDKCIQTKLDNRENKEIITPENHFYLLEHPPTITIGKSGKIEHLLLSEAELKTSGVEFIKTNRGGDITVHSPGQIVGYPILDLDQFFTDVHRYLRTLEEIIIKVIAHYGIKGERSENETGVWIEPNSFGARKICAMGVKMSRWVTMHGFALNVNNNLKYFDYIVPCGIKGKNVTSIEKEIGTKVNFEEVKELILNYFMEVFQVEMV